MWTFKLPKTLYVFLFVLLQPLLSVILVVMSFLAQYDISKLSKTYPNWLGLFNFIDSINFLYCICLIGIFVFILNVIKLAIDNKLSKMYNDLKNLSKKHDLVSYNVKNLFDGFLVNISRKLGIKEGDATRLSLYIHDGKNSFVPCGRYCPNPKYNVPGRPAYPDNEGCIGQGWHNGWVFASKNTSNGMSKKQLSKLTMKSKLYIVMRIDTQNSHPIGLLVLESINKNRFIEEDINTILYEFREEIATLIENLKDYIPTPNYASEWGL